MFEAWPSLKQNEINKKFKSIFGNGNSIISHFRTPTGFKTAHMTHFRQTLLVNVSLFLFTCGFGACQIAHSLLLNLSSESARWTPPHRNLYLCNTCENTTKLKISVRMKQHYLIVKARYMIRAFTVTLLNGVVLAVTHQSFTINISVMSINSSCHLHVWRLLLQKLGN